MKKDEGQNTLPIKTTTVEVSFPSVIQVELVQANEVRHYELFLWLVSVLAPIAVGFWTDFTSSKSSETWWSAFIFSIIVVVFILLAIYFRSKVYNGKVKKVATLDKFN